MFVFIIIQGHCFIWHLASPLCSERFVWRHAAMHLSYSSLPSIWSLRISNQCTAVSITSFTRLSKEDKGKGLPQQAEVAQGVPGRLRPRIFLTFGTTRVVGGQPYAPAAFTPSRNPWYSFLEAESTPGHMVPSVTTEKNPQWHHRESIPRPSD